MGLRTTKWRAVATLAMSVATTALLLGPATCIAEPAGSRQVDEQAHKAPTFLHRLPPAWQSAAVRASRLGAVLPGPYAISGTVRDYDGTPVPDDVYTAEWGWYDPNPPIWESPDVVYNTGGDQDVVGGAFSFSGITSLPGSDALTVHGGDSTDVGVPVVLSSWDNDFSTTSSYSLQPGHVQVDITGWPAGRQADVSVGDAARGMAETTLNGSGAACAPQTGFDCLEVRLYDDKGAIPASIDWVSPSHDVVPVTPGAAVADPVTLDWSQARRGRLDGPLCRHSGPPGSSVRFKLSGWPAGYQASFWGFAYNAPVERYYSTTVTSTAADQPMLASLRVPTSVGAGDVFELDAYRSDDPAALLDVADLFQVSTFKASHATITRGRGVRFSGRISDYSGVQVFVRYKRAKQPYTLKATGWRKIADLTSGKDGRFVTKLFHPHKTAWYVARYASPYFPAFTSVIKLSVH